MLADRIYFSHLVMILCFQLLIAPYSVTAQPTPPSLRCIAVENNGNVTLTVTTDDPDAEVYAVKETVSEFANREYKALRELAHLGAPSVQPIAVIEGRTDEETEELPVAASAAQQLLENVSLDVLWFTLFQGSAQAPASLKSKCS